VRRTQRRLLTESRFSGVIRFEPQPADLASHLPTTWYPKPAARAGTQDRMSAGQEIGRAESIAPWKNGRSTRRISPRTLAGRDSKSSRYAWIVARSAAV
jgi:hypothetical protein